MLRCVISLALAALVLHVVMTRETDSAERNVAGESSSASIDIALIVSDADKAAVFYRETLGFQEIEGFSVPIEGTK